MKGPLCATNLAAQINVVLEAFPYKITGKETKPEGYTLNFCFECIITEIG